MAISGTYAVALLRSCNVLSTHPDIVCGPIPVLRNTEEDRRAHELMPFDHRMHMTEHFRVGDRELVHLFELVPADIFCEQ